MTSHVASVAVRPEWVAVRPEWVAFRPRAILAVCSCALMINGVWHARGACNVCHGAGHRSLALEVRGG